MYSICIWSLYSEYLTSRSVAEPSVPRSPATLISDMRRRGTVSVRPVQLQSTRRRQRRFVAVCVPSPTRARRVTRGPVALRSASRWRVVVRRCVVRALLLLLHLPVSPPSSTAGTTNLAAPFLSSAEHTLLVRPPLPLRVRAPLARRPCREEPMGCAHST